VIHLLHPAAESIEEALRVLSPDERERADRFRFEQDATAWIGWRAGLRRVLAEHLGVSPADLPIRAGADEKPELAPPFHDLHFNLSHARKLAAVIVCRDGPVGIDLEPLSRAASLLDCTAEFCHQMDLQRLPTGSPQREQAMLELWVAKEALLKALGPGLGFPPDKLWIEGAGGRSDRGPAGLEEFKLVHPAQPAEHRLAVAVPLTVRTVRIV
jgi:4'-phosphopantetheinyl transferase